MQMAGIKTDSSGGWNTAEHDVEEEDQDLGAKREGSQVMSQGKSFFTATGQIFDVGRHLF